MDISTLMRGVFFEIFNDIQQDRPKGPQPRKIVGTRIDDKRPQPKQKSAALKKLLRGKARK